MLAELSRCVIPHNSHRRKTNHIATHKWTSIYITFVFDVYLSANRQWISATDYRERSANISAHISSLEVDLFGSERFSTRKKNLFSLRSAFDGLSTRRCYLDIFVKMIRSVSTPNYVVESIKRISSTVFFIEKLTPKWCFIIFCNRQFVHFSLVPHATQFNYCSLASFLSQHTTIVSYTFRHKFNDCSLLVVDRRHRFQCLLRLSSCVMHARITALHKTIAAKKKIKKVKTCSRTQRKLEIWYFSDMLKRVSVKNGCLLPQQRIQSMARPKNRNISTKSEDDSCEHVVNGSYIIRPGRLLIVYIQMSVERRTTIKLCTHSRLTSLFRR